MELNWDNLQKLFLFAGNSPGCSALYMEVSAKDIRVDGVITEAMVQQFLDAEENRREPMFSGAAGAPGRAEIMSDRIYISIPGTGGAEGVSGRKE